MKHKITALTLQKRNRQRVNVYLDGDFAFGLARIVAAWLEVGQELTDEKISQLREEDSREVAYQQALKFLNYRQRSASEIEKNLDKHGFGEAAIAHALERLRRAGLVNDARFAQAWVENRSEFRPRSRRALAFELKKRGIPEEIIRETLADIDEDPLAYQAAIAQARKYRGLDWRAFRQKMYQFLARRGFNYDVSSEAVARVWAELQEETDLESLPHEEVDE